MQEIINKVKEVKELTEEEKRKLVARVEKQDIRYGLVWEDHPEDVELKRETHSIVARELEELRIEAKEGQKPNLLLEGDNLHSLELLKDSGVKVDVIYIDPPYNTLNETGFAYNDKIIDQNDIFRHSKWLSFMSKRLELARDLMTEDGVIFISIDDNEQAQLKLLCDSIFGERNRISDFVWVFSKDTDISKELAIVGSNRGNIKNSHEYVLCYKKQSGKLGLLPTSKGDIEGRLTNAGNTLQKITLGAGIRVEKEKGTIEGVIGGNSEPITLITPIVVENYRLKKEVIMEGEFRNPNMVRRYFEGEEVKDGRGQRVTEIYLKSTGVPTMVKAREGEVPTSVLSGFGDSSSDILELRGMFPEGWSFKYQKPKEMIKHIISLGEGNITILDFFAGSGTTGQAVMELNKEDGGNRRFILCTNNEYQESKKVEIIHKETETVIDTKKNGEPSVKGQNQLKEFETTKEYQDLVERGVFEEIGICRAITYERNKRVIEGYTTPKGKKVEGLPNNLSYYKVDLEDRREIDEFDMDDYNYDMQEKYIEIKEGTPKFEDKGYYSISESETAVYIINRDNVFTGEIAEEIKCQDMDKGIYIYVMKELLNDYVLNKLRDRVEVREVKEKIKPRY